MLSWEEIVKRGKQHNKTVICEVEKRSGKHRYFLIKCNLCKTEKESTTDHFNCCFICGKSQKQLNNFLEEAKIIHGNKFNYDYIYFKNWRSPVSNILCRICNKSFSQTPACHFKSYGCKCYKKIFYKEKFLKSCQKKYGNKFNYDLIEYDCMKTKIKIKCNQCNNIFEQRPSSHLSDSKGCPYCAVIGRTHALADFCNLAKKRHEEKFDYSFVEYVNNYTMIKIFCKSCNNIFEQRPFSHLYGQGCPSCDGLRSSESKGENRVAKYLSKNNIEFIKNKTFKTLKDKSYLKPDFYLSELNLFIEYDGEGHYFPCFGRTPEERQQVFEDGQRRDKIKNEWAKANNIPLLRIPYWDFDRIEELIEAFILHHTKEKEIKQLVLEM
jgi:hypothetical protein